MVVNQVFLVNVSSAWNWHVCYEQFSALSEAAARSRTLWISVWHNDRFGRNVFLGDVILALDNYILDKPTPCWYPLLQQGREVQMTSNIWL